ncbi:MAG: DNA gyrase/topoisomerase IV subunit A [Verrucomicrobiota bacterium]|nr:DNA topoisomerase [Verrucomicrobiales bacterium]MAN81701.1 DNA topoisomerase [Verrucomicrobiales bacterium]MED5457054.1 DNA gyrase/topoisomerase IV subunit A [Verrucomicrobiota bacterium]|tara:strand:+ start:271 stop:2406 length:2136 start_codon:yes stop_codon:yes gene_type:complete
MAKKKVVKKIIKRKVLKKKVPKGGTVKKATKKTVKKSPRSNTKKPNKSKRPKPKDRDPEKAGVIHIDDMYSSWFIDYASYVILERAVPSLNDGLKPVQRRILHSLKEKDDGRYNKVANVVGHTMQYHPHGDASIADALVAMGQKDLLIDTQGNWGNILTGDKAAATRYIEARLSKFALAVAFNSKTTNWAASYDGRNQEPVNLPFKFPLLLAHGAEGIAVGLACKILPHNFNELIDGCIDVLRKKRTKLMPDFPTGGIMDASEYNGGLRGGKVRVRARIEKTKNKRLLKITEIPFGTTAGGLMDNIVSANEKGKIKISKIEDITAEKVEINVHLPVGLDPDTAIEALFAFTDCEVTISPNSCVIEEDKPRFYTVDDLLKKSSLRTRDLLKWELEIKLGELEDKWHHSSLERIFIENKIYRRIEECTTWESVIEEIWKGLKPYLKKLRRKVVEEDVVKLTEIKIKRISKYDSFKADELIKGIEDKIKEVKRDISQITRYTIRYYKELKEKFGKGRERKTEVSSFSKVIAKNVAVATETIYLNSKTGFAGWGLKSSGVSVDRCSRMDDLIVFGREGTMQVSKVAEKTYVGKNPAHVAIFKKDEPKYYCMIYRDGRDGATLVKRFTVQGVTREKMYDLTKGNNGTRVLFFSAHESDKETPVVNVVLKPAPRLRVKEFEVNFADVSIKGRASKGNILTKNKVDKVVRKKGQLELL